LSSYRALRGAALGAYTLFVVGSCRQILGIEDAQSDPRLGQVSGSQGNGGDGSQTLGGAGASTGTESENALGGAGGADGGAPSLGGEHAVGGESGQAGQAGQPGQVESLCERYCGIVMDNCTGAFAVFTSREACLSVCAHLPEGHEGDRGVDSVQCRLRAATIAKDEVPHYCPIAGPGGNGGCGSNCESLCALRESVCAGFAESSEAACLKECSSLEDLGTFSVDLSQNQYQGPHVQCRLFHVSAAASDDPEQHCLHVDGAAPCRKEPP
jgi:hypothetical protein